MLGIENQKGRDYSEDMGVDGNIILEWIFTYIRREVVKWIHLLQERDQWWALVNTEMNLRTP
jgi:hypothetical protein